MFGDRAVLGRSVPARVRAEAYGTAKHTHRAGRSSSASTDARGWVGVSLSLAGVRAGWLVDRLGLGDGLGRHLVKWLPAAGVVLYGRVVEGRPLDTLRPRGGPVRFCRHVCVGLTVALCSNTVLGPVFDRFDDGGFEADLTRFAALSTPERLVVAVTAGVIEEPVFRGYAVEQLAELTGSRAAADALTTAAVTLSRRGDR